MTFGDVERWVLDHLNRSQETRGDRLVDISEVALHPSGDLAACTVLVRDEPMTAAHHRLAVVDLTHTNRGADVLDLPFAECTHPAWSPDGSRLAFCGAQGEGAAAVVLAGDLSALAVAARSDLPGMVESVAWSPDGSRLALQVAMPGAEISDVFGSGVVGGDDTESWRPRVLPAEGGRRVAYVWDPGSGRSQAVSDVNVWELVWAGDSAVLALTSEEPDEDAWYGAQLTRIDLETGEHTALLVPEHQLSVVRSSPTGRRWSVLSGVQSDRGLPAGTVLVGHGEDDPTPLDTAGVHVTDQSWLDDTTLLVAGLRGLETVVATVDVETQVLTPVWSGQETSGEYRPEVTGAAGRPPVVVLESHRRPPTLGVLGDEGLRSVLAADGPGTDHVVAHAGSTTTLSWRSSDGLDIQGLLTTPDGGSSGPLPLVVNVHGGPTHAHRDTWPGRDPHTSCLVARGYAVLRPNPRGSTGRGAGFAEGVYGDMGGLDVDDIVSGAEHLVALGVADPRRLGIIGISYGGYMASWVPCRTDLFAASVARSPCTDWLMQHLTSNIAEFDRRFVGGDVFDPASPYGTRSPLRNVDRIRTPMLLTGGLRDLAVPASQAQALHTALRERGVPTQLVLYPEEGHGARDPRTLADECARIVAWFDAHLGEPSRPS